MVPPLEFAKMNLRFYIDLVSALESPTSNTPTASPIQAEAARRITSFSMSRNSSWAHLSSPGSGTPIAFRASGMQTDVRIRVFEREFHVHSVVLRLYSAFFRTFLDSADKEETEAEKGSWRYDYVSVMDPDGGWGLEAAKKVPHSPSKSSASSNSSPKESMGTSADEIAFEKLLCAMYHKKYSISGLRELSDMTRLADLYCCLPTFSTSLYTALWHSPSLIAEIPANCNSTLLLAQKLRHPLLFREALVHVVSQWKGYSRFLEGHYSLVCAVTSAYNRVCERLLATNQELFLAMNLGGQVRTDICAATSDIERELLPTQNAHFYRHLYDQWEGEQEEGMESVMESLSMLLENKLVLERGSTCAGEHEFKHGFLCATLEDNELPWNLEEEDW
ncbi:uncharacterized protein L3040_007660 [Drepanopeziza brunnea f. sp. 'multigermtubi']|uniref:BTB domain-containing protein n=1 Tax=Marssonina brunnea f. sp. multigermtubi (strain MB_m1) TaxID=1072389 RepID=K1WYZ0_MARBU|nr:uncharacterized protein MBM_03938 [Drepanopeziza brunnea f. sp. 'multigermtubi' MB_m1]EKD18166.1 hypothetical protein MBM_03938 [Drepanopeziza brunnea f. sp. 'multigermtubi' MB_m1]KAJ5037486.1 hypothetical protein L3040_007660 [Drepanopeziza brunnea f. sp. 'multigermtubi']